VNSAAFSLLYIFITLYINVEPGIIKLMPDYSLTDLQGLCGLP